jgi:hypothetical protein
VDERENIFRNTQIAKEAYKLCVSSTISCGQKHACHSCLTAICYSTADFWLAVIKRKNSLNQIMEGSSESTVGAVHIIRHGEGLHKYAVVLFASAD